MLMSGMDVMDVWASVQIMHRVKPIQQNYSSVGIPNDMLQYLVHDQQKYQYWTKCYKCPLLASPCDERDGRDLNGKLYLPVECTEEIKSAWFGKEESKHLAKKAERMPEILLPKLARNTVKTFLGFVHNFTTLRVDAEAIAHSNGSNGIIKYLASLPLSQARDMVNDSEVKQKFRRCEPYTKPDSYVPQCW